MYTLNSFIADPDDDREELDKVTENEDENGPSVNDKTSDSKNTILQENATLSDTKEDTRKPRRPRGCGTTARMKTRIVGGRPADPKEWPWMAALLRQGAIQYCGGVLITNRHVLTAAHCVYR